MSAKAFDYKEHRPKGRITRGKAIHLFCVQCMGGQAHEVRECTDRDCPLFRYRMGREDTQGLAG